MRIAVIGASGRLGAVTTMELASREHTVYALGSADMDVTDPSAVERVLGELAPEAIVNCSAYNAVDAAERDAAGAYALNAAAPAALASVAKAGGAILVHFSTDFVFDGHASVPYTEEDAPNPLSVYGASKLAGEQAAGHAPHHYVLRIESLFGGQGLKGHTATVDHLVNRIHNGEPVKAAIDRTVSPTYVVDAARATARLLEEGAPYGLYHCVNGGYTTWFDLAQDIARQLGVTANLVPMRADDLPVVAPRPRFCALSNRKLAVQGIAMPSWQSAVARHIRTLESPMLAYSATAGLA